MRLSFFSDSLRLQVKTIRVTAERRLNRSRGEPVHRVGLRPFRYLTSFRPAIIFTTLEVLIVQSESQLYLKLHHILLSLHKSWVLDVKNEFRKINKTPLSVWAWSGLLATLVGAFPWPPLDRKC